MNKQLRYLLVLALIAYIAGMQTGCAVMISPGGGPRDTIPPKLITALPKDSAINVSTNKIMLTFDEFVEVKEVATNLIVSPNPKNLPLVDYKLKNVTIKLRDSLEPNTTYSLNFGNSIKDVNEGNPAKNFTYVFSTGKTIDGNSFSGKVILAETGKIDTTLIVLLHKNLHDTAVIKDRPRYYAKLDGKGRFNFKNLPEGKFNAFVLPNDFNKKYDDSTKLFAFLDSSVVLNQSTPSVTFYAYEEAKRKAENKIGSVTSSNTPTNKPRKEDSRLRYSLSLENGLQDVLTPNLDLVFNKKIKLLDSSKIILTDTTFKELKKYTITLDSTKTKISLVYNWKENTGFRLIVSKDAVSDTGSLKLLKTDTLKFETKKESEYGSIKIRFSNLDFSKNPVLQFIQNDKIVESVPITQKELFRKLYKPGEYELRVLFDKNKNGVWDAGNYKNHKQPEIVQSINKKLSVRANWDNEIEVRL
jgi:hypothetical protein